MANTFQQPTQSDLEREQFRLGLASAQNKAYTQSQANPSQSASEIDYTTAPDRVSLYDLNKLNQSILSGAPQSDSPVLDLWKRQQAAKSAVNTDYTTAPDRVSLYDLNKLNQSNAQSTSKSDTPLLDAWKAQAAKKNAQDDFFWDLPFLIGDFAPGLSAKPTAIQGGFGAGRTVPEQSASQQAAPWLNTPQYGDDGTLLLQEKLAQTGNSGYDKSTRKIGGLIDEAALDAAIAEAFPEYSPDDDDEDDWLEKPLQPDDEDDWLEKPLQPDDEDDWLEPEEKPAASGAAWSNPYGGMGVQDEDYQAYRAGKLTQDDLLGIARAVALYRAAEGSGNGAYYYQNDAHRRAAEIRAKYDPDYIKNDAYDYTHGGTYNPNSTEPISGPPVYDAPGGLLTQVRVDTEPGEGYSVFKSPRAPKKEKGGDDALDFSINDKDKSQLHDLGTVVGAKMSSIASLYDENTFDTQGKEQVKALVKSLASTFAVGDSQMKSVADEMFDHFLDGTGSPYSSPVLTERVVAHPSTQKFVAETMSMIQEYLSRDGGSLAALKSDQDFKKHMDEIRGPKFNTKADLLNGLTICINDTWGYYVDISDYRFDGKNYSGTIRYTVYDHFGLDDADISGERNWYKGAFGPFAAWYVLQHYEGCEGKYQPFVTYINFEVPFSGSVG